MDTKIMPEEITLEDGTKREVPTAEEAKALEEKVNKSNKQNEYFTKMKEDLGVKEGESLTDKLTDMKDSQNPNWKAMRDQNKSLKDALKEKGVETDDEGKIAEKQAGMTATETQKIVQETIAKERKEIALSKFSEEERKQIEPALEKAMAMGGTMEENLSFVVDRTYPEKKHDPIKASMNFVGGQNIPRKNANTGVSEEALDIGNDLGVSKEDLETKSKPLTINEL